MSLHHITLQKLSRRSFFTRLREMRTLFLRCSVKRKGSGNKGRSLTAGLLTMISAFTTGLAHSEWQLDNAASQLNFISTKASHIAETHTFDELSGTIDDAG